LQGGKNEKKAAGREGGDGGGVWVASASHCSPATGRDGGAKKKRCRGTGHGRERKQSAIEIKGEIES